jgi:uroporphyrinogen decarboxylase
VFQGNVDEAILKGGTRAEIEEATRQCLRAGGGRRHILNLNHGVDKMTPAVNFQAFVETAKKGV